MMKSIRLFAQCAAILVTTFSPISASADTRSVRVQRGEVIVLSQPHRYEDDCKLIPAELSLKRGPKLGSVVVRDARYNLGDYGGGREKFAENRSDPCAGKSAIGPQVIYRAGDEVGTDRLTLAADFGAGRVFAVKFVVTVE